MVSAIQSNEVWQPRFMPASFRQDPADDAIQFNDLALDAAPEAEKDDGFQAFGDDGFTVLDALDIINPLQHLPLVGPLYRELTGDSLDPFSRIAGSTLFFGPLGTAVSSANVALEEFTGKDMGGHFIALMKEQDTKVRDTEIAGLPPSAAGTDDLDPVTAWAMGEINYQKAEAARQGLAMPTQPYTSLLANAAPATPQRPGPDALALWSPPPVSEATSATTESPSTLLPSTPSTQSTPPTALLALNETAPDYRASPATLERLRRTTNAYRAASLETETPTPPTRTEPKDASTPQATPNGAAATDGGWFTATMIDALSKYRQADETDQANASPDSLESTLH